MIGLQLLLLSQFLDVWTTIYQLSLGGIEDGIVMRHLTLPEMIIVKSLVCVAAYFTYLKLEGTVYEKWLAVGYWGAAIITLVICSNNVFMWHPGVLF